jgi:hypothetical protein
MAIILQEALSGLFYAPFYVALGAGARRLCQGRRGDQFRELACAFSIGAYILAGNDPKEPNQEFHPVIRRLLDEFGNREDVLRHIEQNTHTFGWAGSLTTYFGLYQAPLKSLENHPKGPVRRWAKKMLASIERHISEARDDDDEQQAHWDI